VHASQRRVFAWTAGQRVQFRPLVRPTPLIGTRWAEHEHPRPTPGRRPAQRRLSRPTASDRQPAPNAGTGRRDQSAARQPGPLTCRLGRPAEVARSPRFMILLMDAPDQHDRIVAGDEGRPAARCSPPSPVTPPTVGVRLNTLSQVRANAHSLVVNDRQDDARDDLRPPRFGAPASRFRACGAGRSAPRDCQRI